MSLSRIPATIAVLATTMVGAVSTAAITAEPTQAATAASTCAECCEGDPVCVALAGLADLRGAVTELVPQAGLAHSLVVKVDAATDSVLDLNVRAALGQLDAFGHEVDALAASGEVSPAISNIMKTKHDTVKNSISNIR